MDHGIWAIWYDIAAEHKSEYLDWYHRVHIPEKLSRPGYLWGAHYTLQKAGKDCGYVALFGGLSSHTFLNPSPAQLELRQSPEVRRMVAMRRAPAMGVFAEELRVDGPEVDTRGPGITPGPVIQFASYNVPTPAAEDDLGAWYAQHRLPVIHLLPGAIGARKLLATVGAHKHAVLYEFISLEHRSNHFLPHDAEAHDGRTWSSRVAQSLLHAARSPAVGQRIWPPVTVTVTARS